MADDVDVETTRKKLSHKLFKRLLQKEKRRFKRQKEAEARKQDELVGEQKLQHDQEYGRSIETSEAEKEKQEILQREINEKLWREREAKSQEEFRQKKEDEERRIKLKEEQERSIKLEWEREQQKEQEQQENKEKVIKEKEEALFREIQKEPGSSQPEGSFHNPVAPTNYGTEKDVVNCSFFLKTGACRFGERCSRFHPRPSSSTTLLIPSMYADIRHIESALDIADCDTGLEFDEQDLYDKYLEFFDDVYPEFQSSGRILQFKVCCNYEQHLRGNVYVQYTSEEECQKAFAGFNGRWYAGRQLSCEFSPVTNWKSAICGFYERNCCPRGKNCNFLHVYHNPDDSFDQGSGNRRYDRHHSMKSWTSSDRTRSKHNSYRRHDDDDRDARGYGDSRRRSRRRRSRSYSDEEMHRKRRSRNGSRGSRRRSRNRSRSKDRSGNGDGDKKNRNKSRSRSRDGSGSGGSIRSRNRSRSASRSRYRSGSCGGDSSQNRSRSRSASKSRSGSRGRGTSTVNDEGNCLERKCNVPLSVNGDKEKESDVETKNGDSRRRGHPRSASREGDLSSRSHRHKSKKHKKHKRSRKRRDEDALTSCDNDT